MRVKVTFSNGTSMYGELPKDDYVLNLRPEQVLPWIMNDERKFIPFIQPNGLEVQLNKQNVALIVREGED